MKIVSIIALLATLLSADTKIVDVEGASITYTTSSLTKFGTMEMKSSGTEHLYLKNWGAIQLHEEKTTQQGPMGNTSEHEMTLFKDGIVYSVDFQSQTIEKVAIAMAPEQYAEYSENWRETLKKMGAKKLGSDKVAGYTCEEWEMAQFGAKTCIYKGLALRTTVTMAGMQSTSIATKIDISVPSDKHFQLPAFKIVEGIPENSEEDMPNMDEMNEMMKNMQGLFNQKKQ